MCIALPSLWYITAPLRICDLFFLILLCGRRGVGNRAVLFLRLSIREEGNSWVNLLVALPPIFKSSFFKVLYGNCGLFCMLRLIGNSDQILNHCQETAFREWEEHPHWMSCSHHRIRMTVVLPISHVRPQKLGTVNVNFPTAATVQDAHITSAQVKEAQVMK